MSAAESAEKSVEVSAKSVEEAIEKGLETLGVSREAVEITVLKEASRGILGLGASDAQVRLVVHPSTPPAEASIEDVEPETVSEAEQVEEIGKEVLAKILGFMEIDAQVEAEESNTPFDDSGPVVLNITGHDLGLLIGRRGETLNDLQYLTRLIVGRRLAKRANLVVDVEGYKARRERALVEMAHRVAEQVKENQKSSVLEPMPANERRIVHLALRDYEGVTTHSVGEGERRKVMIIPEPPA